ncbi:MAG: hydrogenase formation protein HypD [Caldimicrobium sp.]
MKSSLSSIFKLTKDPQLVKALITKIKQLLSGIERPLKIMEFCGGHTHSLLKFGLDEALKPEIEFLHGPGCPVCVLSHERLNLALRIAQEKGIIFTTYGDLMRVPNSEGISLLSLRAKGKDIRMVSNAMEALSLAKENPKRLVIFFALGFETTTPQTAFLLERARAENITNLKIISNHILTTSVLEYLLSKYGVYMDGILGPGHVSAVIGASSYEGIAQKFDLPIVISGFDPLDILLAVKLLCEKILRKEKGVYIAYERAVTYEGNLKAKELIQKVFKVRESFSWRGLGEVPKSGLSIKEEYEELDGEKIFESISENKEVSKGCLCGTILQGRAKPPDCKLFGKVCTPSTPIGPCMVSSEGACLAYFKYKGPLY